jgi:hypothetical protein
MRGCYRDETSQIANSQTNEVRKVRAPEKELARSAQRGPDPSIA